MAISFFEENSHNIKSAKVTKIVDTNGDDITDKATYVFSDGKFSFIKQSDLKGVLDGMVSTSAPATNTLTVTFEITTDSTEVLNTTATVDVDVYLVKTQKFDNQATILQGIITSLGAGTSANQRIDFDFSKGAGIELIELFNTKNGQSDQPKDALISDFIDDILNLNHNSIKKNSDYKKYFDNVDKSEEPTGIGTPNLTLKLKFTPKIIYDMELTVYTIKLDAGDGGNWI